MHHVQVRLTCFAFCGGKQNRIVVASTKDLEMEMASLIFFPRLRESIGITVAISQSFFLIFLLPMATFAPTGQRQIVENKLLSSTRKSTK
jgi:hypothetical protein